MLLMLRPLSYSTGAGRSLFAVSPSPSSPAAFSPQVHTNPFSSSAQAMDLPIDTLIIFVTVVSILMA